MKKILVPESLPVKELQAFLIANKSGLIKQKKGIMKYGDPVSYSGTEFAVKNKPTVKAGGVQQNDDPEVYRVKVVANTALWCDQALDVLLKDCWKQSITQKSDLIPHLEDHVHKVSAQVGDVVAIYSEEINLVDLGLDLPGSTQCLIFETDIQKSYNAKIFNLYKKGKIKQHSIGLMYVKIELAINNEEYKEEFAVWNKYFSQIINKDFVTQNGYFWAVQEIRLLENSAVLWGCNELTGDLTQNDQQAESTEEPEATETTESKSFFSQLNLITNED